MKFFLALVFVASLFLVTTTQASSNKNEKKNSNIKRENDEYGNAANNWAQRNIQRELDGANENLQRQLREADEAGQREINEANENLQRELRAADEARQREFDRSRRESQQRTNQTSTSRGNVQNAQSSKIVYYGTLENNIEIEIGDSEQTDRSTIPKEAIISGRINEIPIYLVNGIPYVGQTKIQVYKTNNKGDIMFDTRLVAGKRRVSITIYYGNDGMCVKTNNGCFNVYRGGFNNCNNVNNVRTSTGECVIS